MEDYKTKLAAFEMKVQDQMLALRESICAEAEKIFKQKQEETIYVPDNIQFYRVTVDRLGIGFNNNKQVLLYNNGSFLVYDTAFFTEIEPQPKLIQVSPEDRKIGYTYYYSDSELLDIKNIGNYCKYLGDGKYQIISSTEVSVYQSDSKVYYWYQVVPVED